MSTAGSSNPEYVNARVRSRRARLFDEDDYRKLVRMGPSEIARFMEESSYEAEINELGTRHSGVDLIEYALNRNLAKQFDDVLHWADGRLYEQIARYLRKFDAWNVKTAIRGVYSNSAREAVDADLIRAGEFDERLLTELLDADSVERIVEALEGTMFGDPLADAMDDYDASGVLVPLENAVDRAFYEQLLEDLPAGDEFEQYRRFLRAEVDFSNARNVLRIAFSGADLDPSEYFIEGGSLFSAGELSSLARSPSEVVERIRTSPYGDTLESALSELESAESLAAFERALDAALLEFSDTLGRVFPLSVGPVVSYILAKEREVDNIRAIARGREAGLDAEEIESELVIL